MPFLNPLNIAAKLKSLIIYYSDDAFYKIIIDARFLLIIARKRICPLKYEYETAERYKHLLNLNNDRQLLSYFRVNYFPLG